jgi:hypothetical protein
MVMITNKLIVIMLGICMFGGAQKMECCHVCHYCLLHCGQDPFTVIDITIKMYIEWQKHQLLEDQKNTELIDVLRPVMAKLADIQDNEEAYRPYTKQLDSIKEDCRYITRWLKGGLCSGSRAGVRNAGTHVCMILNSIMISQNQPYAEKVP